MEIMINRQAMMVRLDSSRFSILPKDINNSSIYEPRIRNLPTSMTAKKPFYSHYDVARVTMGQMISGIYDICS